MINALVQNKDQTAILKLPSDPFILQCDLSHIGIRSRLRDIPIKDDEESPVRVKLFADSDIGNSLAVLFKPSHSLEDANLCAHGGKCQTGAAGRNRTEYRLWSIPFPKGSYGGY